MPSEIISYHKTRIAPTPSGFLHLGNVLSFAITAALAKKHCAKIMLRIDDLDQARANKHHVQDIFDTLNFLEIPWDEGPRNEKDFEENYSQTHRMPMYREALTQLAKEGLVFVCTCSRSQLENNPCNCINKHIPLSTKNACWRLITSDKTKLEVKNYNGDKSAVALPGEMKNFIVKKKDGFPAYQLTSVVDDLFYGVDLIVRGEDLWPSTLAQHELSMALHRKEFQNIAFYQHPLLMGTSGQKLSKSAGATSVKYLRDSGKKPADIYRLIASMLGSNENINDWELLAGIVAPHL